MENQAQKFTVHLSFPATKLAFLSTAVFSWSIQGRNSKRFASGESPTIARERLLNILQAAQGIDTGEQIEYLKLSFAGLWYSYENLEPCILPFTP